MATNDIPKFLKRQEDSLLFAEDNKEFIFYVPEIYFDRKDAIIIGEYVNLIGILDYAITPITNVADAPPAQLKPFFFPTVFLTKPYTIDKVKKFKLTPSNEPDDYRLLKYRKNDIIVVSTKVPQSVENVEDFYRLFLYGHLPTTIDYDKMHNYFIESISLNGNSYGISLQLFGIIVSEMCRDKKDLSKPFRLSGNTDMKDYTAISIKDIPKFISPHSSITSENWDDAVVGAITTKNTKNSPMEKLIMG